MPFLDHIIACNRHDLDGFRRFIVAGAPVGWVRHDLAGRLADWRRVFQVSPGEVALSPALDSFSSRSSAVSEVVERLAEAGDMAPPRDELYPVSADFRSPPLMQLDRTAVARFGVTAYGVHMNGYQREGGTFWLWIARRSADRRVAPGELDNLVAGGQPIGIGLEDNLVKEAHEEAGISQRLARCARPVGAVSYLLEVPEGLRADVLFVYDLELPRDFEPVNGDGEIEAFYRWPAGRVLAMVRDGGGFKFNVNLVLIDFGLRHGLITPEEPDYLALCQGLRRGAHGIGSAWREDAGSVAVE